MQRVEAHAWDIIQQLADKGGWNSDTFSSNRSKAAAEPQKGRRTRRVTEKPKLRESNEEDTEAGNEDMVAKEVSARGQKRKAEGAQDEPFERKGTRRSTRARK